MSGRRIEAKKESPYTYNQAKKEVGESPDVLDLKRCYATPEGKLAIDLVIKMCGVDEVSFNANNPTLTAFREGQRNIGIKLKKTLDC